MADWFFTSSTAQPKAGAVTVTRAGPPGVARPSVSPGPMKARCVACVTRVFGLRPVVALHSCLRRLCLGRPRRRGRIFSVFLTCMYVCVRRCRAAPSAPMMEPRKLLLAAAAGPARHVRCWWWGAKRRIQCMTQGHGARRRRRCCPRVRAVRCITTADVRSFGGTAVLGAACARGAQGAAVW